jgi:hypothetical protein
MDHRAHTSENNVEQTVLFNRMFGNVLQGQSRMVEITTRRKSIQRSKAKRQGGNGARRTSREHATTNHLAGNLAMHVEQRKRNSR